MHPTKNQPGIFCDWKRLQVVAVPVAIACTTILKLWDVLQFAIGSEFPMMVRTPHAIPIHEATVPDVNTLVCAEGAHDSDLPLRITKSNELAAGDEKGPQAPDTDVLGCA